MNSLFNGFDSFNLMWGAMVGAVGVMYVLALIWAFIVCLIGGVALQYLIGYWASFKKKQSVTVHSVVAFAAVLCIGYLTRNYGTWCIIAAAFATWVYGFFTTNPYYKGLELDAPTEEET